MGGPLSCLPSDLFLEEYEKKIRFEINDKVIGADWLRFRDDTWLIWEHSLEDLHAFVSYLNLVHPRIQWTFEIEKNNVLSFLDVLIRREDDGSFTTSVFRKKTHSDRYLHFSSDHPLKDKISGLKTLKYRAIKYCSNEELLKAELQHLSKVFIDNGYPVDLVRNCLQKEDNSKPKEQAVLEKKKKCILAIWWYLMRRKSMVL